LDIPSFLFYFVVQSAINYKEMFHFRISVRYLLLSLLLLGVEIYIGARVHDSIIRPYGGDFLVVILLYCLVRSFWDLPVPVAAGSVLVFSYLVEASQYFNLADRLGFRGHSVMRIILGSYFTWTDILCYTLGILSVLTAESALKRRALKKVSIVRRIWGQGDTVMLIFAGASAEFALNRSVDWLYFTGRLPADPIGRLFSTVRYAQQIVFAPGGGAAPADSGGSGNSALAAIDRITAIHQGVETNRGARIPGTAYLDVLFLLIDYSIRAFELLERKMKGEEKAEVFEMFYQVGLRMGLQGMPDNYEDWELMRSEFIERNLNYSEFTTDLYRRYRVALGSFRYRILLHGQAMLVPGRVAELLSLPSSACWRPLVFLYRGDQVDRVGPLD
jgi:hypothetical protein